MAGKKRVSVKIFGNEYTVVGESSVEYMQNLAKKIDEMMKNIGNSNNKYSPTMIAVLTALNLADDLSKKSQECEFLNREYKKMKENYDTPIKELKSANQDIEALKEHSAAIQEELSKLQIEKNKLNRENKLYKDEIKNLRCELDVSRSTIKELQNKLFENQIELLKAKKGLDKMQLTRNKKDK